MSNGGIRILIAEDDEAIRTGLADALSVEGYEVVACKKDGRDIIQAVKKELPDVIIIDMFMANYDAPLASAISRNFLKSISLGYALAPQTISFGLTSKACFISLS